MLRHHAFDFDTILIFDEILIFDTILPKYCDMVKLWVNWSPIGAKSPIFNRYSPVAPQP